MAHLSLRVTCGQAHENDYTASETEHNMADLEQDDPIAPPQHDRLGVLSATASVVRSARLVRLRRAPVEALAARWAASLWPQEAGLDALHFSDGTPRTANWVLL